LLLLIAIEGAENAGNNLEKRMKKACHYRPPPTKVDGAGYFFSYVKTFPGIESSKGGGIVARDLG
jgi:hypothetical protein